MTLLKAKFGLAILLVTAVLIPAPAQEYIEIESIDSVGDWEIRTELSGYQGDGYFYWTEPNKYGQVPDGSTLTYQFSVETAGKYHVDFLGRRDLTGPCEGAAFD